ncbi:bifunctional SulP family inorganic anion transporter/carbonic anhydrase [Actinophytocola xanthii]|uniref:Carbonic anhydrase n=1 Tax=Actinophytocola xanthii TaxID=1912961 RepID=A0A1Q8CKK8_9PSEU|nr:bifunctional SulP family inorganic anion transporter/carbonic anhydrase [Actinophytocola xanthii]OLF14887.1 carbonic anhydrase [Actinophytocola xanthii]
MIESTSATAADRCASVLRHDLPASLVVFLVAVPLSIGIALASGAPVAAGLVAAIVGGVVVGLLGGSPLQVSGPAAGLIVIVGEAITRFGWAATCAITVLAGVAQVLFGLSRIARAALAISPAVVHGMLAGIGITIVLAQLHVLLGGDTQVSPVDNLLELPGQVIDAHGPATAIGVLTLAILVAWNWLPSVVRRVPGPLIAVLVATVVTIVATLPIDRVRLPDTVLDVTFAPVLPSGGWGAFALTVLTIALVASVESLLSAVAVDKLHTGPRANLDRELIGQGAANIVSGSLGGLPVTGVIVRSSTNVAFGARTRASAILHGLWVLVFVALFAGVLAHIPLAALASLLVYVGVRLVHVGHLRQVRRHGDLPVYLVTVLGVLGVDLLGGVLLGIAMAGVLTLRRLLWTGIHAAQDGEQWRIVIEGALAALSIPRLSAVLAAVPPGAHVRLELVVDYLDHAAFDTLSDWQRAHERTGGTVVVDEFGHPWFGQGKAGTPTVHRADARRGPTHWFAPWSEWQRRTEIPRIEGVPAPRSGDADAVRVGEPTSLLLTCVDIAALPASTPGGPGRPLAVSNLGNLVPDPGADGSLAAALELAVRRLGAREIVVCGHASCTATTALVRGEQNRSAALGGWLRHASVSLDRARTGPPVDLEGDVSLPEWDRLALHNVLAQLERLREHPAVATALARGELTLTGMYVDTATPRVYVYDQESARFRRAGHPAHPNRVSG